MPTALPMGKQYRSGAIDDGELLSKDVYTGNNLPFFRKCVLLIGQKGLRRVSFNYKFIGSAR